MSVFTFAAASCAAAFLVFFALGVYQLRRGRWLGSTVTMLIGALMLACAALAATLAVGTRGYQALTREVTAASVTVAPAGARRFTARMRFPDGTEREFQLAGDELYVDAHVLKWKPLANLLGLHTDYELARIAGRYADVDSERIAERTVFALSTPKPVDLFTLRRRFPLLRPLVDAEYGSATFISVDRVARFDVRVSTTGLLIRPTVPQP